MARRRARDGRRPVRAGPAHARAVRGSHPKDNRVPAAVLLLGRAQLGAGDAQAALESFRRAQTFKPPPGRGMEVKFWEAEALFRLRALRRGARRVRCRG